MSFLRWSLAPQRRDLSTHLLRPNQSNQWRRSHPPKARGWLTTSPKKTTLMMKTRFRHRWAAYRGRLRPTRWELFSPGWFHFYRSWKYICEQKFKKTHLYSSVLQRSSSSDVSLFKTNLGMHLQRRNSSTLGGNGAPEAASSSDDDEYADAVEETDKYYAVPL